MSPYRVPRAQVTRVLQRVWRQLLAIVADLTLPAAYRYRVWMAQRELAAVLF